MADLPALYTGAVAALAVAGVAGSTLLAWGWSIERRDRRSAEADLDATRTELAAALTANVRASEASDALRSERDATAAALRDVTERVARADLYRREADEAAAQDLGRLRLALDQARRAAEDNERAEESARRETGRLRDALRDVEGSVGSLQGELRQKRVALATAEAELDAHRRALTLLGVQLDGEGLDPRAPERRAASRAILGDLVTASGVRGAALVDGRGLPQLAVGSEPSIHRVALGGAVLEELLPAVEAQLREPLALLSLGDARAAVHLLRPADDRTILGVESTGGAPVSLLRAASLRLRGRPAAPPVYAEVPGLVGDVVEERDPRLEDALVAWGRRRPGVDITLVDPAGVVRAAWGPVRPAVALLRRALGPLVARARRDGTPLGTLEVEARGERGTLALRFVNDRPDASLLVARSSAPLSVNALDELAATLRWMRPTLTIAQGAP